MNNKKKTKILHMLNAADINLHLLLSQ